MILENPFKKNLKNTGQELNSTFGLNAPEDFNELDKNERREARLRAFDEGKRKIAKKQVLAVGIMAIVDIALPLLLYYTLRTHIKPVYALLISGIPPLIMVLYTFIRQRKVDALGCIFVISFIISAVVSIITGDARIAVLRDSIITGVIGIIFAITLPPIHIGQFKNMPLGYLLSQHLFSEFPPICWTDENGTEHRIPYLEWLWVYYRPIRVYFYLLTGLWAIGLCGECIARVIMVEATDLTIDQIVTYGTVVISVVSAVLGLYSAAHSGILRRTSRIFIVDWLEEHDFSYRLTSRHNDNEINDNDIDVVIDSVTRKNI